MPDDKNKKSQSSGRGMGGGNPIQIEKYLKGVEYPATRQDLLDAASENEAPEEVMDSLSGIAEKEYGSPAEVSKEVGNSK